MNWSAYIKDSFGLKSDAKAMTVEQSGLPLYLTSGFKLYSGKLESKPVVWAELKTATAFTPDFLVTQSVLLDRAFKKPVIYVFQKLDSWNRKRLIEKRISFIQPSKQLYLPEFLIDLSDVISKKNAIDEPTTSMTFPAQFMVLFHLLKEKMDNKPLQDIAADLGYSSMTVSRIVKELKSLKLADVTEGKKKFIRFSFDNRELWDKSLPFMKSPVMTTWYCDNLPNRKLLLEAGEHALADYGMLSTPKKMTYAMGKQAFRGLEKQNNQSVFNREHGDYALEVWQYDPKGLVLNNDKKVDRLSLYLSLLQEDDERIKLALKQLINERIW